MRKRMIHLLTTTLSFLLYLSTLVTSTFALLFNEVTLGSGVVLGFLDVDAQVYYLDSSNNWVEIAGTSISITNPLLPNDSESFKIVITNSGTISAYYDVTFRDITSCVPGYEGWCYDGYIKIREGQTYYPMREVLRFFVSERSDSFLIGATGDVSISSNVRLDPGEDSEIIIEMLYDEEQGSYLSSQLGMTLHDLYWLDFNATIDIYMQQI